MKQSIPKHKNIIMSILTVTWDLTPLTFHWISILRILQKFNILGFTNIISKWKKHLPRIFIQIRLRILRQQNLSRQVWFDAKSFHLTKKAKKWIKFNIYNSYSNESKFEMRLGRLHRVLKSLSFSTEKYRSYWQR